MPKKVAGLLLAAGQGSRMGGAKALVHARDGSSWLIRTRERMLTAGCADVITVLGAEADRAAELLGDSSYVVAQQWSQGVSESLRAGLRELLERNDEAALVHLVDLPDVDADVMRRILADAEIESLKRAVYSGIPGHPVLIGRAHWEALFKSLHGDSGANRYLKDHDATAVECGDLATGKDVDTADGL